MIPLKLSFYLSTFLGDFLVHTYYMNAAYPFESVDISYYSQGLIYKLTSYSFNPKITLYMTGIFFGYLYHILAKKIPTPRFLKGIIVALIIFMLYILILLFSFDSLPLFFAYCNFNICGTLRASGQPLTPVSIPGGQDAADDHAARGGLFPPTGPLRRIQEPRLNVGRASWCMLFTMEN